MIGRRRAPTSGTRALVDASPGTELIAYKGLAYFRGSDTEHGAELRRSDVTSAGTFMESDLVPGPTNSWPFAFHAAPDALFFTATVPRIGNELFVMRN